MRVNFIKHNSLLVLFISFNILIVILITELFIVIFPNFHNLGDERKRKLFEIVDGLLDYTLM